MAAMHNPTFDLSAVYVPRTPHRDTTCAGSTPITLDGITLPAIQWAARLELKWNTVKMRRLRGATWVEALNPELQRTTFMSRWHMHG
jgi:hypothetical protein